MILVEEKIKCYLTFRVCGRLGLVDVNEFQGPSMLNQLMCLENYRDRFETERIFFQAFAFASEFFV